MKNKYVVVRNVSLKTRQPPPLPKKNKHVCDYTFWKCSGSHVHTENVTRGQEAGKWTSCHLCESKSECPICLRFPRIDDLLLTSAAWDSRAMEHDRSCSGHKVCDTTRKATSNCDGTLSTEAMELWMVKLFQEPTDARNHCRKLLS